MSEITVLLVDDHSLVRKGFRRMLEDDAGIRVVGEAADGSEAVKLAAELKPRVIVMDMAMPGLNGMQASIEILKILPHTAILMLSMYSEENYVRNALEAGAKGYILKDAMDIDLAASVKQVAAGERVLAPGLLSSTPEHDADTGQADEPREADPAINRRREIEQGDRGAVRPEREHGFSASRESDGSAGYSSDGGAGAVCGAQGAGPDSVTRRDLILGSPFLFGAGRMRAADRQALPFRLTEVTQRGRH